MINQIEVVGDIGQIDLRNLIYSLSVKEVSVIDHIEKSIPIPKTRSHSRCSPYYSSFVEIDDNMKDYDDDDDDDDDDLDDSFNVSGEDEITQYTEYEYYEDDQSDEDERSKEVDEEDEDQECNHQ
eukprot:CAMPEP_0173141922 /NCGR_PEP_ID=MMETSP1105-20130129/5788_1 /TAXON_ID=2985 /ORGANISM="Ochromonas sp., Strain BG-1" /LENGTH=124 /DNA_ID=CAMNT_0014055229 /DNA_START=105 /DNA_END=480 /DNA_ORIENTATION=-